MKCIIIMYENYMSGIVDIVKIDSNENIADVLTKSLGRNKFVKFREMLNVILF